MRKVEFQLRSFTSFSLGNWTPFGPVMTFGENVKQIWESKSSAPPVMHMELYTIEKLSFEFDLVTPEKIINTLKENNINVVRADLTLKEIANENNTTPAALYELISLKFRKHPGPTGGEVPQGIGQFTIMATAESTGKDIETLVQILKAKGIDANGETTLRSIADKLGISPREVYIILSVK